MFYLETSRRNLDIKLFVLLSLRHVSWHRISDDIIRNLTCHVYLYIHSYIREAKVNDSLVVTVVGKIETSECFETQE